MTPHGPTVVRLLFSRRFLKSIWTKLSPICRATTKLGCEPVQHEFFPHSGLSVTPEPQRLEPRLWIRRLAIWREPGAVIRDIRLRPGLNVVWSPDSGSSESAPIGHGS